MIYCDDIRAQLAFYLDDELSQDDRQGLESHMELCPACRAALNRERAFLDRIRTAGPLYRAPAGLQSRLLQGAKSDPGSAMPFPPDTFESGYEKPFTPTPLPHPLSPGKDRGHYPRSVSHPPAPSSRMPRLRWAIAWAAMMLMVGLGIWAGLRVDWGSVGHGPPDFAMAAVDVHRRYLRGALPLEIASDDPAQVSTWFAGKLSFGLRLPDYQQTSGQKPTYRLKGARLVGFEGDYAAYIAYEMGPAPIGLMVTSDRLATPAGGERTEARGLVFHHEQLAGFKVITWADQGLTYALVSTLGGRGEASCRVCHAGTEEGEWRNLSRR